VGLLNLCSQYESSHSQMLQQFYIYPLKEFVVKVSYMQHMANNQTWVLS